MQQIATELETLSLVEWPDLAGFHRSAVMENRRFNGQTVREAYQAAENPTATKGRF